MDLSILNRVLLYVFEQVKWAMVGLHQGSPDSVLEGQCPAEFSSNPNQTNLDQLIKAGIETPRQVCWGKLELNKFGDPWFTRLSLVMVTLMYTHTYKQTD